MWKNILTIFAAFLSVIIVVNTAYSQKCGPVSFVVNGDYIAGNVSSPRYVGPPLIYSDPPGKRIYQVDGFTITNQEVNTNGRTYYNIQSNGVTKYVWQDANTVNNIHAIFMVDPNGATGYPGRRTRYFFSSDTAHTWTYVSEVPSTASIRSGYPALIVLSNGKELVANHTTDGGTSSDIRTQLYVETGSPGDGLFARMNPGYTKPSGNQPIWPVLAPTSNVTLANKVVFATSMQTSDDSAWWNVATGFTTSGPFLGYHFIQNSSSAERQAVALGPNNKVAIAYITTGKFNPSIPYASIEYIESTDNGSTWGAPVRAYTNTIATNGVGAFRALDAIYLGSNLRILFGTSVFVDSTAGSYYPDSTAKLLLWGANINGGAPVVVDSVPGMNGSNTLNAADVFVGVCRGVLGASPDGMLYASWQKARTDTSAVGDNYFDIYAGISYDGGLTWPAAFKQKVTNLSGPLRNCVEPSISPLNYPSTGSHHVMHIIYQQDSIPGSNVNGGILQLARMMYARVTYDGPIGIRPIGSEVPNQYALYQNYPNPFNPSTNIKFSLPKSSFVTLKIYDVLGQEVITLINDYVPAGTKVYTYDASKLASGIYFYTLKAGDFKDSKKMILVK